MSEDPSALMALKNAWAGVLAAAEPLRALSPMVQQIDESAPTGGLDLETYHRLALAQANAAEALRGLVEELERKRDGVQRHA